MSACSPKHPFASAQQLGRFRSKADIESAHRAEFMNTRYSRFRLHALDARLQIWQTAYWITEQQNIAARSAAACYYW
jgi:hypothetical protein